jgi:hypothetical protein
MAEGLEVISFMAASATAAIGMVSTIIVARRDRIARGVRSGVSSEERPEAMPEEPDLIIDGARRDSVAPPPVGTLVIGALLEVAALASVGLALIDGYWRGIAFSAAFAVAIPCWFLVIYAPTTCGVTTIAGKPCQRPTRGILFGCHNHTWVKLFARLGWHTQPTPQSGIVEDSSSSTRVERMKIKELRRNKVVFWLALGSAVVAVISAAWDFIGVVRDG